MPSLRDHIKLAARRADLATLTDAEISAILAAAYGEGEAFTDTERAAWRSAYRKLTGHELDWESGPF